MNGFRDNHDEWLADYCREPYARDSQPREAPKRNDQPPKPADRAATQSTPPPQLVLPDDLDELIPEGWYVARCIYQRISEFWGNPKLKLTFKIIKGEYSGTKLDGYFNLQKKKNKAGDFDIVPGKRSHYLRMMRRVFGGLQHPNGDPIEPQDLVGMEYNIEVVTVHSDHQQQKLDEANWYSKVTTNIEKKK